MAIAEESKLMCCAKYGLHQGKFAQLPTIEDYTVLKQTAFSVAIQPEINLLKENKQSQLCITVPCLGFTDPAFDYALSPWFAVPISLCGFIAQDNQCLSRAKVIGTDINGMDYPLLMDPFGKIDYDLITTHLSKKSDIVTPLKTISFIYSDAQVLNGQGLMPLEQLSTHIEFMLARAMPSFTLILSVRDKRQIILSQREVQYQPQREAPLSTLHASYQDNSFSITYRTQNKAHDFANTRARLEVRIPTQKELSYHYMHANQSGDHGEMIIHHYFGIGSLAKAILIESLIPKTHFIDKLLKDAPFAGKTDRINAFKENAWHGSQLYYELLKGLMNGSVPLHALKAYFVDEVTLKHHVKGISLTALDRQDKFIVQTLKELFKKPQAKFEFIDALDRLLSRDPLEIDLCMRIQLQGAPLQHLPEIKAYLLVENEQVITQYENSAKMNQETHQNEYKAPLQENQPIGMSLPKN